jgi:hypothetical protein
MRLALSGRTVPNGTMVELKDSPALGPSAQTWRNLPIGRAGILGAPRPPPLRFGVPEC